MSYRYAILGAGRQGIAAAYDLARHGDAKEIVLYDIDQPAAQKGADRVNQLLNISYIKGAEVDATDPRKLVAALKGMDSAISAVLFRYNLMVTEAAIEAGCSICDMGGHTETVRKQLALDEQAKKAGISIVPDCGMAPGLNINMGVRAMDFVDEPEELYIWDGGLPLNPRPPWNYLLSFNINGLTNEYAGHAWFIRDGKATEVPCITEIEMIDFEPLGMLEAAITGGGLSTAPWTFEGKLKRMENRTLRYLGHWEQFKTFQQLGLFDVDPVTVHGKTVVPREVYHALLESKIRREEIEDICLIRAQCLGTSNDKMATCTLDLVEMNDDDTGFSAMEKLTGWHSAIIAILSARGDLPRGAVPVELTLKGDLFDQEIKKRGWKLRKATTP